MDEQENAPTSQHQAHTDTEQASAPPIDPPRTTPTPKPKRGGERKEISRSDWIMLWATGVIALGTLVSAGAIVLQWREMVGGGGQTDKLISAANINASAAEQIADASKRNASAAESFSKSSADIGKSMGDAVTQLRTQAEKMDQARISSEKDSNQALKATINSFHNEDRAWVGISEVKPLNYTPNVADKSVSMTVAFTLRNYGHSAAEHVRFLADLESDPTIYSLSCDEVAAKNHAGDVLLPTQDRTLNWVMNLTRAQMESGWTHQNPQLGHNLFLRIVGCIEYSDREGEVPPD